MYLYILSILCVSFLLGGCEISNSEENTARGSVENLNYIAPNVVPSIATAIAYGYVSIVNSSNEAITEIKYTLTNTVGGAAKVKLDPSRNNWCNTIEAHQSCVLRLIIPAGTVAGSFSISASNSNTDSDKNKKLAKPALGSGLSGTIGIEQIPLSASTGADGVSLYYHHTIIAGTKYMMLTGVVVSDAAGDFNSVVVKDERGSVITGQSVMSANLGAGLPCLEKGSVFAILLPAPAIGITQKIILETALKSADGTVSNVKMSTSSYTINTSKLTKQAIISVVPSTVILTKDNPSQVLTIYNSGTLAVNLAGLTSNNKNTEVKFDATSIEAGATSTGTISLVSTIGVSVKSDLILDYAESRENLTQKIAVYQDLVPPLKVAGSATTQTQGKHES